MAFKFGCKGGSGSDSLKASDTGVTRSNRRAIAQNIVSKMEDKVMLAPIYRCMLATEGDSPQSKDLSGLSSLSENAFGCKMET